MKWSRAKAHTARDQGTKSMRLASPKWAMIWSQRETQTKVVWPMSRKLLMTSDGENGEGEMANEQHDSDLKRCEKRQLSGLEQYCAPAT